MKNYKNEKGKEQNQKFKGKKDVKNLPDLFFFFFAFHFQEMTETCKESTKMEISTGKNLKSHREKSPLKNFPVTVTPLVICHKSYIVTNVS